MIKSKVQSSGRNGNQTTEAAFTQLLHLRKADTTMKSKLSLSILAAVLLTGSAQAQFTGDNQTNTISGVAVPYWTANDAYYVGQYSVDDALVIQNGGVLSNTLGYIGY